MGNCIPIHFRKKKTSTTTIQLPSKTAIPVWPPPSSFPSDVLKKMKANATARMTVKLMHVCKFFQHQQFKCFAVKDLSCYERTIYFTLNQIRFYLNREDIPPNLWIIDSFSRVYSVKNCFIHEIVPKIIYINVQKLIIEAENISFENFKVLTSSGNVEELTMQKMNIFGKFGGAVPIEDILSCVPKVEEITFQVITPTFTSKEAVKKCLLPNLHFFDLFTREKDFNVEAFIEFFKIHKTAFFHLNCDVPFNNFEHIHQLQAFVDEIIEVADLRYPPPRISFVDQLEDSKTALNDLKRAFYDKKNKARV